MTKDPIILELYSKLSPREKAEFHREQRYQSFIEQMEKLRQNLGDIEPTEVSWICKNVVAEGYTTMIAADPKVGKTLYAVAVMSWLTRQGVKVMYVSHQVNPGIQVVNQFRVTGGRPEMADFYALGGMNLKEIAEAGFARYMDENGYKVAIFDTLFDYSSGCDLNSTQSATELLDRFAADIIESGHLAAVVIHHSNKSGEGQRAISGSLALTAKFQHLIQLGRKGSAVIGMINDSNISEAPLQCDMTFQKVPDYDQVYLDIVGGPEQWYPPWEADEEEKEVDQVVPIKPKLGNKKKHSWDSRK